MLTAERLHKLLDYNAHTGKWTWLVPASRRVRVGETAGCINKVWGHRQIAVDGRRYRSGRLAFFWMTDRWPYPEIDHKDGDQSNDRWLNLREATRSQNNMNRNGHGASGLKGISLPSRLCMRKFARDKWVATIALDGRSHYLGAFDCPAAAHFAYVVAAQNLFGKFARTSCKEMES